MPKQGLSNGAYLLEGSDTNYHFTSFHINRLQTTQVLDSVSLVDSARELRVQDKVLCLI